ncbi:MAG: glycosyltransferase family 4 protein [Alphaproteobacteria bacterium]|nr:glycosyltransferase family 4 protein [Alphaproteobacteria bacterium]
MRIQLVGSKFPPEYAGAGLRIHRTYARLMRLGWGIERHVLTGSIEFPGNAKYVYDDVYVERLAANFWGDTSNRTDLAGKLLHLVKGWWEAVCTIHRLSRRKQQLLHIFGTSNVTAAAIALGAIARRPMIIELVTAHASALQTLPGLRYRTWLQRRLRQRTVVIAISDMIGRRCAEEGLTKNVWIRPNPVDTTQFFPEPGRRNEYRLQYTPFKPEDRILTMVAKFMPMKNQIFLLDVLAQLPHEFKLVVAGPMVTTGPLQRRDADYLSEFQRRVTALNLGERVLVVPDFVPAAPYIKLADVYMLPNYNEGLATPMLESLACGIPVVANKGEAAFRQWVVDGESGYLCRFDPAAWKVAVEAAFAIPQETRLSVARRIAEQASADQIDRDFRRLAEAVAEAAEDDEIDVAAVLRRPS